jgi:hypothetical protein
LHGEPQCQVGSRSGSGDGQEIVHTQVTLLARVRNEDGAGLRREADVAMMEPTDFGTLDDRPRGGELGRADVGRILVEREMRASPVIVGEVADEDAAEVPFAQDEDVIQALTSDGADKTPSRSRRR